MIGHTHTHTHIYYGTLQTRPKANSLYTSQIEFLIKQYIVHRCYTIHYTICVRVLKLIAYMHRYTNYLCVEEKKKKSQIILYTAHGRLCNLRPV